MVKMSNGDKYASNEEIREARRRINNLEQSIARIDERTQKNGEQLEEIQSSIDELAHENRVQRIENKVEKNKEEIQPITEAFTDAVNVKRFFKWLIASGAIGIFILLLQLLGVLPGV